MQENTRSKLSTKTIVYVGVTAALIAVCSQISFPFPGGIPVTLQTFALAFAGYLLGSKKGTLSVLVFLLLGAAGAPVFAGFKGGLSAITGLTGGFLTGFILMPLFCGMARCSKSKILLIVLSLCGLICVHLCGILWFAHIGNISVMAAFLRASAPFIIKDIISMIIAYTISHKLSSIINCK